MSVSVQRDRRSRCLGPSSHSSDDGPLVNSTVAINDRTLRQQHSWQVSASSVRSESPTSHNQRRLPTGSPGANNMTCNARLASTQRRSMIATPPGCPAPPPARAEPSRPFARWTWARTLVLPQHPMGRCVRAMCLRDAGPVTSVTPSARPQLILGVGALCLSVCIGMGLIVLGPRSCQATTAAALEATADEGQGQDQAQECGGGGAAAAALAATKTTLVADAGSRSHAGDHGGRVGEWCIDSLGP